MAKLIIGLLSVSLVSMAIGTETPKVDTDALAKALTEETMATSAQAPEAVTPSEKVEVVEVQDEIKPSGEEKVTEEAFEIDLEKLLKELEEASAAEPAASKTAENAPITPEFPVEQK